MQYKNLLFNLFIFLLFMISIIPGIFAIPPCIAENINNWSNGDIVSDNIYRLIITPPEKPVVVEVIQGGYFDNRNYCINVERDPTEIFGYLNVRTAPLHVICYEAINIDLGGKTTPSPSQNGCWQKGTTIQTFTILSDQKGSIENSIQSISDVLSISYLLNNPTPTDYNISIDSTDITKEYYLFNDSNYTLPLGVLFILIGAFLFFATFFNNNIKEFI